MHFVHRVRAIWPWLPAFRAVAESEHLPTAAQELGIVPSSLSRTVKQVEDELGVPLFERTSKALVLNQAGRVLVAAVREAMRLVDDALGEVVGDELIGQVGAVAPHDLVHAILVPAIALLRTTHPALALCAIAAAPSDISDVLLRGDADAAVTQMPPAPHPDLRVVELSAWPRSVYANPARADVDGYSCVVVGTPSAFLNDGWPPEVERHIAAWAPDERSALELVSRSQLVTVAHDGIVRACGFAARVARLETPQVPPQTIHLTQRRAVGRHRRTEALVLAIQRAVAEMA